MPGNRVQFDEDTWNAVDLLAKDSMRDLQELAAEEFADLLRRHGRPADLKTALRQSAGEVKERPLGASVRRDARKDRKGHCVNHGRRCGCALRQRK
jgi:hypothetical protein